MGLAVHQLVPVQEQIWLTVKDVCSLLEIQKAGFHKRRKKDEFLVKEVTGNGGMQYQILLDSLPQHIQVKYWESRSSSTSTALVTTSQTNNNPATKLNDKQKKVALARFELLTEWLKHRDKSSLSKMKADKKFKLLYNEVKQWPLLSNILGEVSLKIIYKWNQVEGWQKDALKLAPKYHYGKQTKLSAVQANYLLKYIKLPNTKLRISEIIRRAKDDMLIDGFDCPKSDASLRRWIQNWADLNADEWTYCREGQKALNDKILPSLMRDKDKAEVGDMLIIDGHKTNFQIIHPATGKLIRMVLIVVYDYRSDLPLGWELMPTENVYSISSAMRHALLRLGMKGKVVNIDNGRANKSKWFMGDLEQCGIRGLFSKLFDDVLISQPYNGQAKTVERFFGTMADLERGMITYSGTSIATKPPRMMRNEKFHKQIFDRATETVAFDLYQAHHQIAKWFDEYSNRPHQDGFYKGYTPIEIFNESYERVKQQEDFKIRSLSSGELTLLMMSQTITKLYPNGIRFRGNYYFHHELYRFSKENKRVSFEILYDDQELDSIIVKEMSGKFLCEAFKKTLVHPLAKYTGTPEDVALVSQQLAEKNELKKLTIGNYRDYCENVITPQIERTVDVIKNKELKKQAKKTRKLLNSANDVKLDLSTPKPLMNSDESPDFYIKED
ncbi:MAG: transposase [Ignavibacteriales bacterium]|nr:MAG: transposase [Ignavibacteriales bacterium]